MLNAPLSDGVAALRVVASTLYQDGWLDRIVVNPFPSPSNTGCEPQDGFIGCARGNVAAGPYTQRFSRVNWERLNTLRPKVLIQPTDRLSITVSALYQETKLGGYDTIDQPPGCDGTVPCGHYEPLNVPEPFADVVRLVSGVVRYDTPIATITSATSYWNRNERQTQDASEAVENILGPPFVALPFSEVDSSAQFSEELRATSNDNGPFQWVAGLYYSLFQFGWTQSQINSAFAGPGNPQGQLYVAYVPMDTKQDAAFAELSYKITSAWKLTAGLRAFHYEINANQTSSGIFTPNGDATPFQERVETADHGLNPKVNLAYIPDENLTAYATASKGFRPGGISEALPLSGPASCLPSLQALGISPSQATSYGPDSLWNYELGEKSRLLDGRLTVHSDVYYIRWSDIQYLVPITCGYILGQNAGNARSYGSELEIHAKLTNSTTLSLSGGYTNAEINQPRYGITPDQPLLNIPKYTVSAALDYQRPVFGDMTLTGHIVESIIGPEWDVAYFYEQLPSYALTNLRVGLARDRWMAFLFVDNATNKMAIQTINNTFFSFNSPDLTRATINQPRTVGVKLQWRFR
jgi:outer membrane receptor protein involved in Fe transport